MIGTGTCLYRQNVFQYHWFKNLSYIGEVPSLKSLPSSKSAAFLYFHRFSVRFVMGWHRYRYKLYFFFYFKGVIFRM
jgi:hypothetical protein